MASKYKVLLQFKKITQLTWCYLLAADDSGRLGPGIFEPGIEYEIRKSSVSNYLAKYLGKGYTSWSTHDSDVSKRRLKFASTAAYFDLDREETSLRDQAITFVRQQLNSWQEFSSSSSPSGGQLKLRQCDTLEKDMKTFFEEMRAKKGRTYTPLTGSENSLLQGQESASLGHDEMPYKAPYHTSPSFFESPYHENCCTHVHKKMKDIEEGPYKDDRLLNLLRDVLHKSGANLGEQCTCGTTPLILATQDECPKSTTFLLFMGVDQSIKDVEGRCARDYATDNFILCLQSEWAKDRQPGAAKIFFQFADNDPDAHSLPQNNGQSNDHAFPDSPVPTGYGMPLNFDHQDVMSSDNPAVNGSLGDTRGLTPTGFEGPLDFNHNALFPDNAAIGSSLGAKV